MLNNNYIINKNITIKNAMQKLDDCDEKILFILEDSRLLASVTDGDIRRFLISGGSLEDEIISAANKNPKTAKNIQEAKQNIKEFLLNAVPIIKDDMFVDIYFKNKSKKTYNAISNVDVVVNAGGKGTRLDPYTRVFPKPLIPVGDLPILEIIMQEFNKYSIGEFSVIVNYKKELIKTYFKEIDTNFALNWFDEEVPLGTGGGLSLLKNKIKNTFIFTNCDTLIRANYDSIIRFHKENHNDITMVCAYKNINIPYGIVEINNDASIKTMKEKPEFSILTNTGFYVVEPSIIDDIEPNIPIGFPDIIKNEKEKGKKIGVYPISEQEWLDMGQLPELEKMREKLYGE